jgi:hypothetical protein
VFKSRQSWPRFKALRLRSRNINASRVQESFGTTVVPVYSSWRALDCSQCLTSSSVAGTAASSKCALCATQTSGDCSICFRRVNRTSPALYLHGPTEVICVVRPSTGYSGAGCHTYWSFDRLVQPNCHENREVVSDAQQNVRTELLGSICRLRASAADNWTCRSKAAARASF